MTPFIYRHFITLTTVIILLMPFTHTANAIESQITKDPHRTNSGFFDMHICNWPDRPPFYLTLFGTEEFNNITSIEVFTPNNLKIGELDLKKFTVSKKKNKPERRVFLTQLPITNDKTNGWFSAKINFKNKTSQSAKDFIIHQTMQRATGHSPKPYVEDITIPKSLSWNSIPGATLYKVFIKDLWDSGKVIHTSKLIKHNQYNVPKGVLKEGGYYAWRVHARDLNEHIQLGDFNAGSLSSWVEFSVEE